VHGDYWIYHQGPEADRVIEGCPPDHDDQIRGCYRVRAVSHEEALKLSQKAELALDMACLIE
jgi:hypothetical protein